ncbi:MAG: hypothetical protein WC759_01170 [Candidatus Micrarchaeia archaeon]|jgi:hypothetical protein
MRNAGFLLLIFCLLAGLSAATGVYVGGYASDVDSLYGSGPEPATLAQVTHSYRCAKEVASIYIVPSDVGTEVRVAYVPASGPEQQIFDELYDPSRWPSGHNYTYIPPYEGEYKFTIVYIAHSVKTKYLTIECTAESAAPSPAPSPTPTPAPVPTPSPEPAPATVNATQPAPSNASTSNVTVPPEAAGAYNALSAAKYTIDTVKKANIAAPQAEAKLAEAQAAYDAGQYAKALLFAREADSLAEQARSPVPVPSTNSPLKMVTDNALPIGGVILVAIVLFIVLRRRGESGSNMPPREEKKEAPKPEAPAPKAQEQPAPKEEAPKPPPINPLPPSSGEEGGEWRSSPSSRLAGHTPKEE